MTPSEVLQIVEAIRDRFSYHPNAWENDFLDSMEDLGLTGGTITERQAEKLQFIYKKVFP